MSTDIVTLHETGKNKTDLDLTQFYGGKRNGTMLQLTQDMRYIQLTKSDAALLVDKLMKWLRDIDAISR